MGFVEDCQYIRKGWNDQEMNIHLLEEPLLFNYSNSDPVFTLGIGDCSRIYIHFTCHIDCNKINWIYIDELQGTQANLSIHHYGTMLLSTLFEHIAFMESRYSIKFSYISGEMTSSDKALYYKRRGRKLSDFYIDAIPYVQKYVPQKDISIEFYHDRNLTIAFQGESKEQAHYFKYVIKEEG